MNTAVKDISVRALKTFLQSFLATLAVSVATVQDYPTAKAAVIGALAAAISAAWNAALNFRR